MDGLNVKFSKVKGGKHVRTQEVNGVIYVWPEVGTRFVMYSDPLKNGDMRVISTSSITAFHCDPFEHETIHMRLRTLNSEYLLTFNRIELEEWMMKDGRPS